VFAKNYSRNYADIYVQLKEYEYNEFNETIRKLRKIFKEFTGAKFSVQIFEQGVPIDAPVMIYIDGENVDTLKSIAGNVEKYLEQATGAINVENLLTMNKTDLQVTINRDKAGMLGIPVHEIDKTVRAAINGLTISSFRDSNGDEYNIVVRLPYEGKITIKDFERVYVTSLAGKQIPLLQVASAGFSDSPGIIKRRNMSRTALLTADVLQGYSVDEVLAPVIEKLDKYPFPTGYTYYIAGEPEARGETFGGMGVALMIAVIAVFAVLVLQFRSFLQPLIIFISFLLAFIGVALALYLTGNPFSFTAFIGFISLAGIVVNNAIILIDYTNRLRKEGKTITDALLEAGQTRFTPIILTTLTTIGGLLPLTLQGGDMWAPLGWTIIGGLLVSTVLTLVVVPVIYSQIETMNQRSDDFSKHKIIYAS
ncbi:MAG: efflux RND transporter permease subunit, partial [Bacteroidetes bacterium]|nr:efflux RND transporter permease subunit [Bacteroidota bacterium]